MVNEKPTTLYLLKVALKGRKSIWRRLALAGHLTLDDLHQTIFQSFDRYDEHLYAFYFPRSSKGGGRSNLADITANSFVFYGANRNPLSGEKLSDARATTLDSLKLLKRQRFEYLFDFGDEWWHEITVEEIIAEPHSVLPNIVEKHGKSPPQYGE